MAGGKYLAPHAKKELKIAKYIRSAVVWIVSAALALTGAAVAYGTVYLCLNYSNELPMLLSPPDSARGQLETMLGRVCTGDYDGASQLILGTPDLGVTQEGQDALGIMLWNEFVTSMEYELVGECYTTEDGLAQDIEFRYMDLTSVTEKLRERSQALMEQRVQEAEDTAQIYDEDNNYREEFVMEVLNAAAEDALREDARQVTVSLTVNLKYQAGSWWVVADTALLDAISGGFLF